MPESKFSGLKSANQGLPVAHPSKSYWIEEAQSSIARWQDSKGLPEEADVVIVGSGYTGTAVAANLMLEHWTTSGEVLMLEARDACSGATGRNGGHIRSYYYVHHKANEARFGAKTAAQLTIFEADEAKKVEKLAKKYKIDCNFEKRTSCHTFEYSAAARTALDDYYSFMANPHVPKYMKESISIYFGDQAKAVSGHDTPVCILSPTASLWPYKLVTGLLQKCIQKGLNLQTNTPVQSIYRTESGKWLVITPRGVTLAQKVVLATNAYTKSLLPEFNGKIVPVKGCVSHMKPLQWDTPKLPFNYYHTYPMEGDYVTARHDNSIIAGGGGQTYLSFPQSVQMLDNTNDSVVPAATAAYFQNFPNKNYADFEDAKFINDYTWTGVMGYTDDEFPLVGDLTEYGRPNMYISAGYTGHGMPRIWSCGSYIADLVAGRYKKTWIPDQFKLSRERMSNKPFIYLEEVAEIDPKNKILCKL